MAFTVYSLRKLITRLIERDRQLSSEVSIKILRRDKGDTVTHKSIVPINYIDSQGRICVEESLVNSNWEEV